MRWYLNIIITDKLYSENIPKCCKLKTLKEHKDVLFYCWGLINNIKNDIDPSQGCETCEFHVNN